MNVLSFADFDRALDALPGSYPGPGGAVAVLKDGKLLANRSWGWADIERRIPFTSQTLFRVCSITKQFTCSVMLDQFPDPTVLDEDVRAFLPLLRQAAPHATHLSHNQSGLRDYWALAMLCGSPVEAPFTPDDAHSLIARTRSLHFQPGTRYSYCNQNFRILADIVSTRTGRPYDELLRDRIFERAGMPRAQLCADTSAMPDGTLGYEGSMESGYRAAVNRIIWTGDAGMAASLDDMAAWEAFIDATRDDPDGLYNRLSAPPLFEDGAPASYGFGLSHMTLHGQRVTGHGGGLRGWRSFRFYAPGPRISIVVLFNHMADPRPAALDLFATLLDRPAATARPDSGPGWNGSFQEPETGLVVRMATLPDQRVQLYYSGHAAETLDPKSDDEARGGATQLRRMADGIWMDRPGDHQSTLLAPCEGPAPRDVVGEFRSEELDATFSCVSAGGALYGAFTGFLGQGEMQALIPVGPDVWRLPMPRALDSAPPGDWTLQFHRAAEGGVTGVTIGCWLARRVAFVRI